MRDACPGCMRLENSLAKLRKENQRLRSLMKQTPLQEIRNMRAEFQEVKEKLEAQQKQLASIKGYTLELVRGPK